MVAKYKSLCAAHKNNMVKKTMGCGWQVGVPGPGLGPFSFFFAQIRLVTTPCVFQTCVIIDSTLPHVIMRLTLYDIVTHYIQ